MKYESLADMPAGMRQKLVPHIVAAVKRAEDDKAAPVKVDGILFADIAAANRYKTLKQAAQIGIIRDLHVNEWIVWQGVYTLPGGTKVNQQDIRADFSYIVADFDYNPLFLADDLEAWEAMSEQAPGERLYEFVNDRNLKIADILKGAHKLYRFVRT